MVVIVVGLDFAQPGCSALGPRLGDLLSKNRVKIFQIRGMVCDCGCCCWHNFFSFGEHIREKMGKQVLSTRDISTGTFQRVT